MAHTALECITLSVENRPLTTNAIGGDAHSMSFLLLKYFRRYSTCQVASPSRHSMEKMEK